MRFEFEVYGLVLRVTLGPDETHEEEEATTYEVDRLYLADFTHAGAQEDPVFPNLDWGDDEERRTTGGHAGRGVGLGRGQQRGPDHSGNPGRPSDLPGGRPGPASPGTFGFGRR